MDLKDGQYYWVWSTAICQEDPIMIGQFAKGVGREDRWRIGGQLYTAGIGIEPITHIPKPTNL